MTQQRLSVDKASMSERDPIIGVDPFAKTMAMHGLELKKGRTNTLQINIGFMCNQACRHCHLEAGPHRPEMMTRDTIDQVADYAKRALFQTVDITGGAPEINPNLDYLIEQVAPVAPRLMVRANLTALAEQNTDYLIKLFKDNRVIIVGSFPSISASQTDAMRGAGVLEKSLAMVRKLNDMGYGVEGTGLELNLVSNPTGAFLPACQSQAETKFKKDLWRKWGLTFNKLFTFANAPLGRFLRWLEDSGNYENYMRKLSAGFNPFTVEGLMCRTLISVSWEGYLFDCDFNLARGAHSGGIKRHVSKMGGLPEPGSQIPVGDHCYACAAGSGFT